jgi:ubiquinone/menaquinone biosynthesis C-methylase UbiE
LTARVPLSILLHDCILSQAPSCDWGGPGDYRPVVKAFRYWFDPVCLSACLLYAVNRWLIEPVCKWPFLHEHFNDLLLIPAALPLVLGLQRWLGLRNHDLPPMPSEIFRHLVIWSLVSELLGPLIFPWAVGDILDVFAYALGGLAAGVWWNQRALVGRLKESVRPSQTAQFDRIAGYYDWMETLLAGRKLERCRNAFWDEIPFLENALLVGEGHGKFLASLLQRDPGVRVTCVDASSRMLEIARQRLISAALPADRVEFIRAELPAWNPPAGRYDLLATHFFLDCFPGEELAGVVNCLREAARPGAYWLVSDFQIPGTGLRRLRARIIHRLMYGFFRVVTKLPASALVAPQPFLRQNGFVRVRRAEFDWGLLCAELWKRA